MEVDTQIVGADDSVQVVLIGSTGSGKSCTGNTILGNKHFPSDDSAKSVTLKCKSATETIHGRRVSVVDTPGWDCTELHKHEVEAEIREALKNLRGPFSFLLVIRIGGVESDDINKICRLLGPSFLKHTTILFSHSDNLAWKTFEEFLQQGGAQFQALLKACGHRCHFWDNRNSRFDEDVEKVLRHLKMTEMKDQYQTRSSEEPVHENRAEQKGSCGSAMEVDTQTGGADGSVQVVLIGSTGSGKSCTGNTILGNKHFPSDASAKSVTRKCKSVTETIHGRGVTVVDTPGWDCTELHKLKVEAEIQEALKSLRGPFSFLLVIRIGGVESDDINKIYGLQQVLGPSFLDHTTILFSHSDDLEQKTFQQFLQQGEPQFQALLKACGHRCYSWNNRDRRSDEDVEKVLRHLKMIEMKDQHQTRSSEELVHRNRAEQNGSCESAMEVDTQTGGADGSVQVVLIGSTGSGKSCTGNTILGNKHFPSDASAKSVTRKSKSVTETIHGRRVTVVDTPGWDCTELHKLKVEAEIQETLKSLRGPFSFLLVIRIGGVESDDINKIYGLQQVLGPSFLDHTTILFSHSDDLEQKTFQQFLQQGEPQFQALLKACGHRCYTWNNRDRRSDENVEKVLRHLKMTEMMDQHQTRSSEEPVHRNRAEQSGSCESAMEVDTQTGGADGSVQVVLIGSTGSGKSCTGNTILGNKHFPSDASAKSVTRKYKSVTETIHGRRVTVVDTPGWDCTELHKLKVEAEIQEALKSLRGPFSFLLVIRIGGVESDYINKIYGLQQVLGPSFLDHTTILFSHSDDLEQKTFQQFQQQGEPQFQALLKACGHRCYTWSNRDRRSDENVEKVLRHLKMTEMMDQHQTRSSEEPVHRNRAEQKGICGKRSREMVMVTMDGQNSRKPIRVLFLGMTKTGKTSSIRTLQAKCERTEDEGIYSYSPGGLLLQLIDSPGFDQNQKEIHELISKSKPHIIVMVLEVGRFSPAVKTTMQHLQHTFLRQNATKHTIILFTGKDNLEGAPIEKFIKENADLNNIVEANGRRFHALNNRDTSDHRQVEELLQKIANLYEGNKGVASGSVMALDTQMRGAEDSVQDSAQRSKGLVNQNRVEQKRNCGKRSRETNTAAVDAQNSRKPIRVLFLGMTKTGKTSSIRTLRAKCERTKDEDVYSYSPAGLLLQLIDSPGFDQNQKEIQELISKFKPHVIVIVMEVRHFSPAMQTTMQHIQEFLGLNATKQTMILFTGKDNLHGAPIEKFIEENEGLKTILEVNGRRFHALNNQDTSDHRQVEELLQKIANLYKANKGGSNKLGWQCSLM